MVEGRKRFRTQGVVHADEMYVASMCIYIIYSTLIKTKVVLTAGTLSSRTQLGIHLQLLTHKSTILV